MIYHATVQRSGKFWAIYVDEIDRGTQARRLDEVDYMTRDLISAMTDLDPDTIEVEIARTLPDEVRMHLDRANELRDQAAQVQSEAARESRAAVKALIDNGVTQREAGKLLGMSFQRVSQLVRS